VGQVGDIVSIDPSVVKALQDDQFIPVISPIGFGEHNESYNINADVVAGKLATVLKAEKLVLLTNTPGVLDKTGKLLTDLTAREIDELFADGTISGGMLPKIAGALDAAKSGVNSVHIIDGRVPHAMLLEILTEQAYGTMIRSHCSPAAEDVSADIAGDLPRVTRKRPKPGERRVQILQALAEMLQQPGAERITTAALAARLSVSEAALYRHFASKAQMFEGLIEFIEQTVFSLVNQIAEREQSTPDAASGGRHAAKVVAMVLQFAEKNPGMTRVMVGDALVFENERLRQRMNQFFDKIEATLRQGLRLSADAGGSATPTPSTPKCGVGTHGLHGRAAAPVCALGFQARADRAPGRLHCQNAIKIEAAGARPAGAIGRFGILLANDGDGLRDKASNGRLLETANLRTQRTQRFRRGRRKPEDPSAFFASSAKSLRPLRMAVHFSHGACRSAALIEYLAIIRA
jgi:AcrR family transcriptional regulator